jgi:2-desacetyl-2-hydroxyethyl bacteriochlorophyllide A dehydrogenase
MPIDTQNRMPAVPKTMKAVYLTGYGDLDRLRYVEDAPVPAPASHEVLIQVGACGINNTDLWTRQGAYGDGAQAAWLGQAFGFPRIQGLDAVGRVVRTGDGVSAQRLGQRVLVNPCIYTGAGDGLDGMQVIGSERDGGFAQYLCVPQENALPIDSPCSDAELATFMTPYMTAEHMLRKAGLRAGERVLVTGASGGVGSALVQLALLRGAEVVAVSSKAKVAAIHALGVDTVITREEADYPGALRRLGAAAEFDVVADIVAGDQVAQCLDLLRTGGRYVTAGAVAGPMVQVDWRKLYLKQLSLYGVTMGTSADAQAIICHIESGRLRPLLAGTFPLRDMARAQQVFAARAHVGSWVIVLDVP